MDLLKSIHVKRCQGVRLKGQEVQDLRKALNDGNIQPGDVLILLKPEKTFANDVYFWKLLIDVVENDEEVLEVLMERLAMAVVESNTLDCLRGYLIFEDFGQEEKIVEIKESRHLITQGTTALRTWEAALKFGELICQRDKDVMKHGQAILELGSGTGFLGILMGTMLKPCSLIMSDVFIESRPDFLKDNVERNRELLEVDPRVIELDWLDYGRGQLEEICKELVKGSPETVYIVATDISFAPELFDPLFGLLQTLITTLEKDTSVKCLFGITKRDPDTFQQFLSHCNKLTITLNKHTKISPLITSPVWFHDEALVYLIQIE